VKKVLEREGKGKLHVFPPHHNNKQKKKKEKTKKKKKKIKKKKPNIQGRPRIKKNGEERRTPRSTTKEGSGEQNRETERIGNDHLGKQFSAAM